MSKEGVTAVRLGIDDALVVFESLSEEEWSRPSGCAGWRVQDVAAHAGSNFKATVDPPPPPAEPLAPMPAERMMDLLVEPRSGWTPEQVLDEVRTYGPRLLETLDALQLEPVASSPMTMADLGTYKMHQLADAYAFVSWATKRSDLRADVTLNGDRVLATRFLDTLNII